MASKQPNKLQFRMKIGSPTHDSAHITIRGLVYNYAIFVFVHAKRTYDLFTRCPTPSVTSRPKTFLPPPPRFLSSPHPE